MKPQGVVAGGRGEPAAGDGKRSVGSEVPGTTPHCQAVGHLCICAFLLRAAMLPVIRRAGPFQDIPQPMRMALRSQHLFAILKRHFNQ